MQISLTRDLRGLIDRSTDVTTKITSATHSLANVDNTTRLHSPANFIPAPLPGLQFAVPLPATDHLRHGVTGAPGRAGELDAAIRGYEALGEKHGVESLLLHGLDTEAAGVMVKGGYGWESGGRINAQLGGRENVVALTDAARAVLKAAGVH